MSFFWPGLGAKVKLSQPPTAPIIKPHRRRSMHDGMVTTEQARRMLLDAVTQNPGSTTGELCEASGLNYCRALSELRILVDLGQIERKGRRNALYFPVE